jgi:alpha-mannosidase
MTSESGYELGKSRTFHYALAPHAGDWQKAAVYREGLELNHPLLVHKAAVHAGNLPPVWGLLVISHPNVVLTAFKPGPDGTTILRVYEASGVSTTGVSVKLQAKVTAANEVNLLEDTGKKLRVEDGTVRFDLHPFEIKTIKLKLAPARR